MAGYSSIEWTETTWNPATGCSPISDGCKLCYAYRMAKRLKAMGNKRYENGFGVTLHEDLIDAPKAWKRPRRIFVNSMSDLFHEDIPLSFIERIFQTINDTPRHTFQILTKRAERLVELAPNLTWPNNLWMGVTVESGKYIERIDLLRKVEASVRFLSIEPMIGPVHRMDLQGIDWVIVGGESGPGSRTIEEGWVEDVRDQCMAGNTPFFFKQWGGFNKKKSGRLLAGREWNEYPKVPTMETEMRTELISM
jgi:protein gp37